MSNSFAMPRASRLAVAVAAAFIPAIVPVTAARADEASADATNLDSVEVHADAVERREQRLRHVQHSGAHASIGRERSAQSNVVGSEDLLRYAPNLTIRSRYIGDRNALIGGRSNGTTTGSRALVYVDGLLISDLLGASFNPPRWGMVSPAEIETTDVLYGPFSAELPGNSMGTTVQITTRYPRAFTATADATWFSQSFSDSYGFKDDYRGNRVNATLGQSRERWRWFLAANRLDTTSQPMQYATPSGYVANAGALPLLHGAVTDLDPQNQPRVILGPTGIEDTRQLNAKAKVGVDLGDSATLEFVVGSWRNDYSRHAVSFLTDDADNAVYRGSWRLPDGRGIRIVDSAFVPQQGVEQHWQSALSLTWQLDPAWALQFIASDYRVETNELRSATTAPPSADNGGPGTIALGDGTGWNTFDLKLDGRLATHRLRTGVHWDRYVLDQDVFATDDWDSGDPARRGSVFGGKATTSAAYVQDAWNFAAGWELGAGARYEQWRAFDGVRGGASTTLRYAPRRIGAWSPKLSLSRELGIDWTLRASAGKAVRFPTVSELFQGSVLGNAIVNSDPNLQPEVSYAKDLSLLGRLGGGDVRASVFEDDIRDSLFTQTNLSVTPSVTNIQNIGRIRNRGIELSGEWRDLLVAGLDLSANAAFNQARTLDNPNFPASEGKYAPRIPKQRAAAVISYRPDDAWRLSLAARYSGRQWNNLDNSDINPDVFGGTSRYALFDAKVTRQLADGVSLGVGVDNLTDYQAFVYHPYPRRTVFVELRYGGSAP
jgi:iron complex outermembrane receptor protein